MLKAALVNVALLQFQDLRSPIIFMPEISFVLTLYEQIAPYFKLPVIVVVLRPRSCASESLSLYAAEALFESLGCQVPYRVKAKVCKSMAFEWK